jgi:hypothetical protein
MSRFETRRTARLRALAEVRPFVAGSLCRVNRRCGNARCKCAQGEPHQAWVLSFKVKGKTRTVHVPKALVPEVHGWIQEYRRIKKLIREVSKDSLAIIHRHVPVRRAENAARSRTSL